MPELPDLELYLHALRPRVIGASLNDVMLRSPFLLRSTEPPLTEFRGRKVAKPCCVSANGSCSSSRPRYFWCCA